jgi:hypothetical protein
MPFAQVGDQVVYAVGDSPLQHTETVWIAQDGLVFQMGGFAVPEYRYTLAAIAASVTFDPQQTPALQTSDTLIGDEAVLRARMAAIYPDSLAVSEAAIRNEGFVPAPVAATETYTGESPYGPALPGFTVQYDPAAWQFVPGEAGGWDALRHREFAGCTMILGGGATETYGARWRFIGDQWWVAARLNPEILLYSLTDAGNTYILGLSAPESDPQGLSVPCRRAADQVLATLAPAE